MSSHRPPIVQQCNAKPLYVRPAARALVLLLPLTLLVTTDAETSPQSVTLTEQGGRQREMEMDFRELQSDGKIKKAWSLYRTAFESGMCQDRQGQDCVGEAAIICTLKLDHDILQIDHLLSLSESSSTVRGAAPEKLREWRALYEKAVDFLASKKKKELSSGDGCLKLAKFPDDLRTPLSKIYNRVMLEQPPHKQYEDVFTARDPEAWKKHEKEFWEEGFTIIDDLLTQDVVEDMVAYATESSAFTRVHAAYIGAFPPRVGPLNILERIVEGWKEKIPGVLQNLGLGMHWYYKYFEPSPPRKIPKGAKKVTNSTRWGWRNGVKEPNPEKHIGIIPHNDEAIVNINLFLSAPEANFSGGGLKIWQCHALGFKQKNWPTTSRLPYCPLKLVEWKVNRAMVFSSNMPHQTQDYQPMGSGFRQGRINFTLQFGVLPTGEILLKRVPAEYREVFKTKVLGEPWKKKKSSSKSAEL